jgi:hypothetical protein
MAIKKCPSCQRYSVSFDYVRGVEVCRWRDCNWVNVDRQELPVSYITVITSVKSETGNGTKTCAPQQVSI